MGRPIQPQSPSETMPTMVLLTHTGAQGETVSFNFLNGSIHYFERILNNAFSYTMVDNVGEGRVRVTYNRPELQITSSSNGAKTLRGGDTIYLGDEEIWHIKLYFVEASTVEFILKTDKE